MAETVAKSPTPAQLKNAFKVAQALIMHRGPDGRPPRQKTIAQLLRMEESRVSEAISLAYRRGILDIVFNPTDEMTPGALPLWELQMRVVTKLRQVSPPFTDPITGQHHEARLAKVFIVPGIDDDDDALPTEDVGIRTVLEICKKTAAVFFNMINKENRRLRNSGTRLTIGVGWGRTCDRVINFMSADGLKFPNVQVVPLIGMIGHRHLAIDSNFLVRTLSKVLGANSVKIPAPAILPLEVNLQKARGIARALEEVSGCCIAVSGVSPAYWFEEGKLTSNLRRRKMITAEQLAAVKEQGAVAEIQGFYLTADGGIIAPSRLNYCQVGITAAQMQNVRRFIIAGHPGRVKEMIVAVKAGIASYLVMDHVTAHYILDEGNAEELGLKQGNRQ